MIYALVVIVGILLVLVCVASVTFFALWISEDFDATYGNASLLCLLLALSLGILEYNITDTKQYNDHVYMQKVNAVKEAEKDLQKFLIDYPEYKEKCDDIQENSGR